MTEKQYKNADSKVLATTLVIMLGIALNMLGMVTTGEKNTLGMIALVVSVAGALVNVILYARLKGKRLCGILMTLLLIVTYIVMVICVDSLHFYTIAAAIFVISMAYLEFKRIIVSGILTIPVLAVKAILLSSKGTVSVTEAGTTIIIMLFVFVSALLITRIWIVFNKENIAVVKEGADKQKEATDRMLHVSENIIRYFDEKRNNCCFFVK